jgi:hypothetical protein
MGKVKAFKKTKMEKVWKDHDAQEGGWIGLFKKSTLIKN